MAFDHPSAAYLVGNEWRPAPDTLPVIDPATGLETGRIARCGPAEVDAAVGAAEAAMAGEWGALDALGRGRLLMALRTRVLAEAETLAALEARDVGKPLAQGRADAEGLARYLEFYAGAADKVAGDTIPFRKGYTAMTLLEPYGVAAQIVPWNYPMQIIGRAVGAALAMGNACILKPAEDASQTALALAEIARDVLPPGALNVLPGTGAEAGAALAAHPGVRHVSFTGSPGAGAAVQAAAARNAVPVTLELGGKSPQIVFADADLDAALPLLVNPMIQNAGQTCSAPARILVERAAMDEVAGRMAAAYRKVRVGMPLDDPDMGPLVSRRQQGRVAGYLSEVPDRQVVARTELPDLPEGGAWIAPTLVGPVEVDARIAQDEVFGPVQVLIPFDDEADAVRLANATRYGLVASVWTRDLGRAMRCVHALRAGQVFVNDFGAGGGIELPFGGTGLSGHGREKGLEALRGLASLKAVAIRHG